MTDSSTIKLLRECDSGIQMGISAINDVMNVAHDPQMRQILSDARAEHENLANHVKTMLVQYGDEGKDPSPVAKGMSWIKTNVMLAVDESDSTVADLITGGCNMGVKSIAKYLNEYEDAGETARGIAKQLMACEEELGKQMQHYL